MRYCPNCSAEYRDDVTVCTDCGTALVEQADWDRIRGSRDRESAEQFVAVQTAPDQFAAEVTRNALESEGIPVLVRSFSDTSFDGIFIPQKGWAMILVPEEFRQQAENIIAQLDSSVACD